jgi:aryl-alcohol dehydrogenase-like predicted oxidoreductase
MEYKKLDFLKRDASKLVLGTMPLFSGVAEDHFPHLDMAVEMGVNIFDSAIGYGDSELTLGKWMKARGNRKDVIIITKGCHPNFYRKRVTTYDLASDLHDSLARLQTDYIDIYLLHRDDPSLPVGVLVEALNEHYKAGKIRSFGGSNWTYERIQEANEYAKAHGLEPFRASSPSYSLAVEGCEPWAPGTVSLSGPANAKAHAWYAANGMPIFAYSSLARGFFSGRVTRERYNAEKGHFLDAGVLFSGKATRDQLTGHGETIDPICAKAYCTEDNFMRQERALELAKEKGCTLPQIALAYIVNGKMNVLPICGVANRDELKSSMDAVNIKLTEKEMKWLDLEIEKR